MHKISVKLSLIICSVLLLSACHNLHVFSSDVQQGNIITKDKVEKLRIGMTTEQVKTIIGAPVLTRTLSANRWLYIYTLRENRRLTAEKKLILFFRSNILRSVQTNTAI